jgi:hypothetical protein
MAREFKMGDDVLVVKEGNRWNGTVLTVRGIKISYELGDDKGIVGPFAPEFLKSVPKEKEAVNEQQVQKG